jgi:SSS family solute:Na+ symporter
MNSVTVVLIAAIIYFVVMIFVGVYSTRFSNRSEEDYYLASRTLGPIVIFAAIVGTTLTALALNGFSGQAYHSGYGMLGLVIGGLVIGVPLLINTVGYRLWMVSKYHHYVTPVQAMRDRFGSDFVAWLLILLFFVYTIPYISSGAIAAGISFEAYTQGLIPYWLGSLMAVLIVGIYVFIGGMRATAWTNVIQVFIFTFFIVLTLMMLGSLFGGPTAIYERLVQERPELLQRSNIPAMDPKIWFAQFVLFVGASFGNVALLVRFMAANSPRSFKFLSSWYPLGFLFVIGSSVIVGVWGAVIYPGLEAAQSDQVLPLMIAEYLPIWMVGLAVMALFAIIMSTMDAQILVLGSLVTVDMVERYRKEMSERSKVRIARLATVLILVVTYLLSLFDLPGLYQLLSFAFAGTWVILPVLAASLYWRRFNRQGAIAALLSGTVLVPLFQFNVLPHFGFGPLIPTIVIQIPLMILVTLLTRPQPLLADKFFKVLDKVWLPNNDSTPRREIPTSGNSQYK